MIPETIDSYYKYALDRIRVRVEQTPDDHVLGMDPEEWVKYHVADCSLEPLEADLGAMRMEETTDKGEPAILVLLPVERTETFEMIAKKGLAGQAP